MQQIPPKHCYISGTFLSDCTLLQTKDSSLRRFEQIIFILHICLFRGLSYEKSTASFEVRHPRCVSNISNCKVYAYIVKHNYVLGGMLFTIRKAQLHVSATNFGHHQVVQ